MMKQQQQIVCLLLAYMLPCLHFLQIKNKLPYENIIRSEQHGQSEGHSVTVFHHGDSGYWCIRIPSITRCGAKGTLHAFAECRTRLGDGCVPKVIKPVPLNLNSSICYKNSTDDGATWSQLVSLESHAVNPNSVCDKQTNTIILQYNIEAVTNLTKAANWQIRSTDDGATWSSPQLIDLGKYGSLNVGPGRGLQLSQKSRAPNRILFIGFHGRYKWDAVWYSDDGGKTYNTSESIMKNMNEAQLVELSDGSVMANMRNRHHIPCDCRGIAISRDGGRTFSNVTYDHTLISPVCQATIISMNNGSLVFANPANKKLRVNGLIRRSDDNGHTWPHSYNVTKGEYGYSCLTHVADENEVGLLWETKAKDCIGPSCQIIFSKFKVL